MFKTPYQTTPLKDIQLTNIRHGVEQYLLTDKQQTQPLIDVMDVIPESILVLNDNTKTPNIKMFTCPMEVSDTTSYPDSSTRFVIDGRSYTSKQKDGSVKVLKPHAYKNMLVAAILTEQWYLDGANKFISIAKYPTKLFSNWLTSACAKKLNIDEVSQVKANAIFAYFFLCMFDNFKPYQFEETLDEDKAYSYAIKVSYASGLPIPNALNIIQQIPTMTNINDLALALKEHGGSERFKMFTPAYLYTLIARTAFHGYHPDMIYACVEYPPIFYAMIYIAATEKGYNKSDIGNIINNQRSNPDLLYFLQVAKTLIKPI